jgi:hypothetical protein
MGKGFDHHVNHGGRSHEKTGRPVAIQPLQNRKTEAAET